MRIDTPTITAGSEHARTTVYVVQPFELRTRGRQSGLAPTAPVQARDRSHAMLLLERTAHRTGIVGAVAFSRIGDTVTGEFEEPIILGTLGQVPDDLV